MTDTTTDLHQAWALLTRGEFAAARDLAARLLAVDPDNVSALVCHAMAWIENELADIQASVASRSTRRS